MSKRHIPIIEKLGIGEEASGLTSFVETSTGNIQVKTPSGVQEIAHEGNINTILQAAGGAGWQKVQATTASYAITRPASGAGLDLHIESGGSLAALTVANWPVPVNGVDQLRIRNFSGAAKTLTAGAGWTIVTADGNPITSGSYSIPDDRAIEVTLDPDGFAQVVPWGGEVSEATFNTGMAGKSDTTHAHSGTYEPSNANIQSHVTAAHAPANAEMNQQPDWNQATTTADDFIKNKPTIPAATVINNTLTSISTTEALSAAQGKVLQDGKRDIYEGTAALRTPNNLTSNTSDPNFILTASSEHTTHLFYRVFDGNDANHWYTLGTPVANGVIELRYKIRPTNLLLRGETTILEYWTRWQLQGSNNGTTWETLVDRSGADEVIQNTSKNFPITTTKEYKYFRFNGLAAVGTNIPLSRLEISGVESERTFIDWTSYTPVVTSETGAWSNYTATGRYRIVDRMLTVSFRIAFTGATTAADAMYVSIPPGLTMNASVMTGGAGWDTDLVGFGIMGDSGTISGVPAIIATRGTQRILVKYYNAAASSYLTCPGLTNTTPWIWNTQDTVDGQFTVPIL